MRLARRPPAPPACPPRPSPRFPSSPAPVDGLRQQLPDAHELLDGYALVLAVGYTDAQYDADPHLDALIVSDAHSSTQRNEDAHRDALAIGNL